MRRRITRRRRGDPASAEDAEAAVLKDKEGVEYRVGAAHTVGIASAAALSSTGAWVVNVKFTTEGSSAFSALVASQFRRRLAIVADGTVLTAPVVQEEGFGGEADIAGNFSEWDALGLAAAVSGGAYPGPVSVRVLDPAT